MDDIITEIMQLCGIYSVPTTVSEFLWDVLVLVVGLYCIKYAMIFITSLFHDMTKIN